MQRKILVTGGSGFIGTNIIEYYKNKHIILNLDIKPPRNKAHQKLWKEVDLLDVEKLVNLVVSFQPDYIFHMGARTDLNGKSIEDYAANTTGVENLIKAIHKTDSIKKVIFASSRLVCKIGYKPKDEFDYKPSTLYGKSKITGEEIVRESQILNKNWIIVRPTSLWGPWFDVPYKNFFDAVKKRMYFHPKGEKIYKKFGYIGNCIFILDKLLTSDFLDKKTIYLSDFQVLEVKEWADLISQKFHQKNVKTVPMSILKFLSILGDILIYVGFKNAPLSTFRLNNLRTNMDYDTVEVEKIVGKLPYSLKEGTTLTHNWIKNMNNVSEFKKV